MGTDPLAERVNKLVLDGIRNVPFVFKLEERGRMYQFSQYQISHIRHRIDTKDITIVNAPAKLQMNNAAAGYNADDDIIYVDESKLADAEARFKLIHEFTHAAVDVMHYKFTVASNEGVAFLVERLSRGFGTHIDHSTHPTIGQDPLAVKVYDAAEALMMSKQLSTSKTAEISAAEFRPLRDAVVAWYSAALFNFQPDRLMDANLGIKHPSGVWKEWTD